MIGQLAGSKCYIEENLLGPTVKYYINEVSRGEKNPPHLQLGSTTGVLD